MKHGKKNREFFVHLFWVNLRPISSYSEERQCVALDDVEVPEREGRQNFHRQQVLYPIETNMTVRP